VWESMFLPDYLKDYFLNVNIKSDGKVRPLVENEISHLRFDNPAGNTSKFTPKYVTWSLFILLIFILIFEMRVLKKRIILIDRLLLLVTGVIGFVVFYLWFLTEHSATGANYNIMWAMPTNIILAFSLKKISRSVFFRVLGYVTWGTLLVVLLFWKSMPQVLVPSAFPVALIIFIRMKGYLFDKRNVTS
jgi:hypothetical protein